MKRRLHYSEFSQKVLDRFQYEFAQDDEGVGNVLPAHYMNRRVDARVLDHPTDRQQLVD